MYNLLVKLMLIAALVQLGISVTQVHKVERAAREIVKIHWKPISVFHDEAKRFR